MQFRAYWRPHFHAMVLLVVISVGLYFVFDRSWWIAATAFIGASAFMVVLYSSIAVHELGHLIAGRVAGLEPLAIKIGPFLWSEPKSKFDPATWERVQGFVVMRATNPVTARRQMVKLVLGGPTASLVLALVATVALLVSQRPLLAAYRTLNESLVQNFFILAVAVTWTLVLNFVPVRGKLVRSDGLLLWKLRKGEQGERCAVNTVLMFVSMSDKRARDWPTEAVEVACRLRDDSEDEALARYHAYIHFRDLGDIERADEEIRRAVDIVLKNKTVGPRLKAAVLIEGAFYLDDPVLSREWLDDAAKLNQPLKTFFSRAEAAVLDREGRGDEAKTALSVFIEGVETDLQDMPNRKQASLEWASDLLKRYPI